MGNVDELYDWIRLEITNTRELADSVARDCQLECQGEHDEYCLGSCIRVRCAEYCEGVDYLGPECESKCIEEAARIAEGYVK